MGSAWVWAGGWCGEVWFGVRTWFDAYGSLGIGRGLGWGLVRGGVDDVSWVRARVRAWFGLVVGAGRNGWGFMGVFAFGGLVF